MWLFVKKCFTFEITLPHGYTTVYKYIILLTKNFDRRSLYSKLSFFTASPTSFTVTWGKYLYSLGLDCSNLTHLSPEALSVLIFAPNKDKDSKSNPVFAEKHAVYLRKALASGMKTILFNSTNKTDSTFKIDKSKKGITYSYVFLLNLDNSKKKKKKKKRRNESLLSNKMIYLIILFQSYWNFLIKERMYRKVFLLNICK